MTPRLRLRATANTVSKGRSPPTASAARRLDASPSRPHAPRGLPGPRLQLGHRLRQGRGGGLARAVHAAPTQRRAQDVRTGLGDGPTAQAIAAREHCHGRLQPRPERAGRYVDGQGPPRTLATRRAAQRMQAVLGEGGSHWRRLRHLVADRLVQRVDRGRSPRGGLLVEHPVHLFHRRRRPLVRGIARSRAAAPSRGWRGRPGRRLGRVRRGRARGECAPALHQAFPIDG
jgi:hypothetical protein